jgi:hypothetical protein
MSAEEALGVDRDEVIQQKKEVAKADLCVHTELTTNY